MIMIDMLVEFDKKLFLFLNDFHSGSWDFLMWHISEKFTWVPVYLFLVYLIIRRYGLKSLWVLVFIALTVTLCDQLSVHGFKDVFKRLRPCHDPSISHLVHTVNNKCGGQYGFVSSHAANYFGIAVFLSHIFRNTWVVFTLIVWAGLVAYSRVYLGVHYPGDILGGALLGAFIGWFIFLIQKKVLPKLPPKYL